MATGTQRAELSARTALSGTVKRIRHDAILSEVVLDVHGQEVVAVVTRDSAERLGLREGATAEAVIKATDVMLRRGPGGSDA